ncbi:hypothetical protein E1091_16040, partial [Micromonospora fluostatini]
MRGDLDETLARMARREEALRRAADPGSRNAGPRPEAGTGGPGGANRSGLADATGPDARPDDVAPDRRDVVGAGVGA